MAEALRYYLDEHIDGAIAVQLRARGIDAVTTAEAGRAEQSLSDVDQLAYATEQERVLVTRDRDFARLAAAHVPHAGIILLQRALGIGEILAYLELIARLTSQEDMRNQLVYCDWRGRAR